MSVLLGRSTRPLDASVGERGPRTVAGPGSAEAADSTIGHWSSAGTAGTRGILQISTKPPCEIVVDRTLYFEVTIETSLASKLQT